MIPIECIPIVAPLKKWKPAGAGKIRTRLASLSEIIGEYVAPPQGNSLTGFSESGRVWFEKETVLYSNSSSMGDY